MQNLKNKSNQSTEGKKMSPSIRVPHEVIPTPRIGLHHPNHQIYLHRYRHPYPSIYMYIIYKCSFRLTLYKGVHSYSHQRQSQTALTSTRLRSNRRTGKKCRKWGGVIRHDHRDAYIPIDIYTDGDPSIDLHKCFLIGRPQSLFAAPAPAVAGAPPSLLPSSAARGAAPPRLQPKRQT